MTGADDTALLQEMLDSASNDQLHRQLRLAELSNNALRAQVVRLKDQSRKRLKRAQDAEATVRQLRRQIAGVITKDGT